MAKSTRLGRSKLIIRFPSEKYARHEADGRFLIYILYFIFNSKSARNGTATFISSHDGLRIMDVYTGLQRVTEVYRGLQRFSISFREILGVYRGLQGFT